LDHPNSKEETFFFPKNKDILVVGISYKKNIADTRESPAEMVIDLLRRAGGNVKWHDPLVSSWNDETSTEIDKPEIVVVLALHDVINAQDFIDAQYVLDCTGELTGVELL
jgi:UDP-N-acetyl-D-glucosamine dehydrogenase